ATIVGPGTLTCTYTQSGSLGNGGSMPDSIQVTTLITGQDKLENCAVLEVGAAVGTESDLTNNKQCVPVDKPKTPVDLKIVKTGGTSPAPEVNAYAFHLTVT